MVQEVKPILDQGNTTQISMYVIRMSLFSLIFHSCLYRTPTDTMVTATPIPTIDRGM